MAKFYFQASDATQKALADSIRLRQEQEQKEQPTATSNLAQFEGAGSFGDALSTGQPSLMSAQATMAPTQTLAPRPYETADSDDYVPESPTSQSVIDALARPRSAEPKPNVGQRANLWRTQEGNLSLNSEGTKTSSGVDPLGRTVMVTTPSSSEVTSPTMHLTKDQVADLDKVPGYAEELMALFPNHTATELQETRQGEAGDLALIGQVPWEMFEVAQGLVLDPLAQTAAELLPFTEGGSWDPREGFGLTVANEGILAATEKFRDRPWWQELIYGVAFDPTMILGGLGLIKVVKAGGELTYDVVSTAIRKYGLAGGEEIDEASLDAATKHVIKANQEAGSGSARPEGGWGGDDAINWMPKKNDGSDWTPHEILRAGGMDIADDAPLPVKDGAFDAAYDAGMVKLRAEADARAVVNQGEPGPLSSSIIQVMRNVEDDPDLRERVLHQLVDEDATNEAKQQRWDAFLRTTVHVLNEARKAEGGTDYTGLYAPVEFGGTAAQMRIGFGSAEAALPGSYTEGKTAAVRLSEFVVTLARRARGAEPDPSLAQVAESSDVYAKELLDEGILVVDDAGNYTPGPNAYFTDTEKATNLGQIDVRRSRNEAERIGEPPPRPNEPTPTNIAGETWDVGQQSWVPVEGAPVRGLDPGGALTVPPTMRPAGELPMATRSVSESGPTRSVTAATDELAHEAELDAKLYDDPRGNPPPPSILARTRNLYEQGQALFIDKFAAGNAASSRAQREFLKVINNFVEDDMNRINAATIEKWRALGVDAGDVRVTRELVTHKTPGYERVRRMPVEFNFEYQASLGAGMPGAARRHSGATMDAIKTIVKNATSDAGIKLRVSRIEQFLTLRHAIDVIRMREIRALEKIGATGGELPEIKQSGMNLLQAQNELKKIEYWAKSHIITRTENGEKVVTTQWDEIQKAVGHVTQHYRDLLKMQIDEGMVSPTVGRSLEQNYPYYNPIKYVESQMLKAKSFDKQTDAIPGVAKSLGELADEGLDADVVRPLSLLTNITTRTYMTVQRNKAMRALIPTLMFDDRNRNRVVRITNTGERIAPRAITKPWEIAPREDMVRVARMVGGETEIWEIPKSFERVVDSLIAFDPNMAERVFRTVNKVPRSLFTAHNPVFFTYNFLHDTLAAFIVEGVMPWEVAGDLMRNIRDIRKTSPELDQMMRAGAQVGGFGGVDAGDILRRDLGQLPGDQRPFWERMGPQGKRYDELVANREAAAVKRAEAEDTLNTMQRAYDEKPTIENANNRTTARNALAQAEEELKDAQYGRKRPNLRDGVWHEEFSSYHKWRNWVTSPIRLVGDVAEAVETAPRRSVWKKVKGEGLSDAEAAVRSRRVTVDFQRRGRAVGLADAMFLYTNAAIQGFMLPFRAARAGWAPRLRMAGLSAMAMAAYMWNTQEDYGDAYDEMSAQDKYTKLSFMVGHRWNQYGQKVPVSVAVAPLLREFSMFTAPVTFTMSKLRGRSEQAHWKQMWQAMLPTMNPTSHLMNFGGRDATFGWQGLPTPTTFGTMLTELYTNWDSFRNEPIVPPDMEMIEDQRKHYDAHTSLTAREVGQAWGMSPKKIDHFLRMGALRDVILGVDQVFRWFDKGKPDPELEAMAYEFQNILDMETPSDEDLQGTEFGSAEEWQSKNRRIILNEYIRDAGTKLTSTEKRELMIVLDELNKSDRMYTVDGQPVPFATSMVNRFLRTQGGNKSRLGQMRATEEMAKKGYDIDVRQTRDAAGKLNVVMETLRDGQLVMDSNLWQGQRPEGDGITERVGTPAYMDAGQWRSYQRDKGAKYAMAMALYAGELQQAAQLQGLDLEKFYGDDYVDIGQYQRDTGNWEDYKNLVATGVGAWDDTRTKTSHLAAGYRGIQMTEIQPGVPDFKKFFDEREKYEDFVRGKDWDGVAGDDMWSNIERDLTSSMTSTEVEYYKDMKLIREYWDISSEFTDKLPEPFQQTWEKYLTGSQTARDVMKLNPMEAGVIKYAQKQVDALRQVYRQTHPQMDAVYIKWGYAQTPVTYDGMRMKMWLMQNYQTANPEAENVTQ